MEPLWSPVVATGGTQWQIRSARNPPKQAESVAAGCERLPEKFHGKQGVCRRLPPVARGPLPAKEGVDVTSLLAGAICYCCSPGKGTARSRSRCMPRGSWRDDTHGLQPSGLCPEGLGRQVLGGGRAGVPRPL